MTSNLYDLELERFPETFASAVRTDISGLTAAISEVSQECVIGVGSGGSFTVASLLCGLHEAFTGRISRPSTPLEIICRPALASSSPAFFISAEGKNPDIIEALQRARHHSSRALHVITNRQDSELLSAAADLTDIETHVFNLTDKDGFLATNSLLLNSVLVARAYTELDDRVSLPARIEELKLHEQSISEWLSEAREFAEEVVNRKGLIVVYSPDLRSIAIDIESKLAEAALLYCQTSDLRSFAHGRHLWISERPRDCAILALVDPALLPLWDQIRSLLPNSVPIRTMCLAGDAPEDLLAGLVVGMHLISALARQAGRELAKPEVHPFGRKLHYLQFGDLVPQPSDDPQEINQAQYDILGARWPWQRSPSTIERAESNYRQAFAQHAFRALIFDYDGTLCRSRQREIPPPKPVLQHLCDLVDADVIVAIASGRGGSVRDRLRESMPKQMWGKIVLGLYNGGQISTLDENEPIEHSQASEFLSHILRIVGRLKEMGVPIASIRPSQPHQVSIRFRSGVNAKEMWFIIADALRQAGLDPSCIVHSKHSIDILEGGVNKAHLIAHIVQQNKVDPYEVLTLGDLGAWPGNDFSLLEHRFSLSVDVPSRRLDRGWKLAPESRRDVDATLWYLERIQVEANGRFRLVL